MHSPLKLAIVALLGLGSLVTALPGGPPAYSNTPPGYGGNTESTSSTTGNGIHTTSSKTTGGGVHTTSTKKSHTTTHCSETTKLSTSVGHHQTVTCKPSTGYVTSTITHTVTRTRETQVPYTTVVSGQHTETTVVPYTTTKTIVKPHTSYKTTVKVREFRIRFSSLQCANFPFRVTYRPASAPKRS